MTLLPIILHYLKFSVTFLGFMQIFRNVFIHSTPIIRYYEGKIKKIQIEVVKQIDS